MTSMRIDKGKSLEVWNKRFRNFITTAMEDGVTIHWDGIAEEMSFEKGDREVVVLVLKENM